MSEGDRIEESVLVEGPRARAWAAWTDVRQFADWFGMELQGPVAPGRRLTGVMRIPEVAGLSCELELERADPERLLAWRWHPGVEQPPPGSPLPTRVEIRFEDAPEGTRVTVVETGFDALPPEKRDPLRAENVEGWKGQLASLQRYLAGGA